MKPIPARRYAAGFTLVEMMVALGVAIILFALAVPSFTDALLGGKLTSYANKLVGSSYLARSEAIKRNAVATLCSSNDGATCTDTAWENGWIVLSGTTLLQRENAAASGFHITGSVTRINFQPTGVGATQASFTICRYQPAAGSQERAVRISATGRASVETTTTGVCTG